MINVLTPRPTSLLFHTEGVGSHNVQDDGSPGEAVAACLPRCGMRIESEQQMNRAALFAKRFRMAEQERSAIAPIAEEINCSLETVYQIQEANVAFWLKEGREQVGWKIGLTSQTARTQMKVPEPMLGVLFADMEIKPGRVIDTDQLIAPRIEPEVAVVLKDDVHGPRPARSEVLEAIDFALPAFEIVDCRSRDWKITGIDAIADNALASGFVLGETRWSISDRDLADIEVSVSINEAHADKGSGINCMGHPVTALQWLVGKLHDRGRSLSKGDLVLTGSLCPMIKIAPGDTVMARFNETDELTVRVR